MYDLFKGVSNFFGFGDGLTQSQIDDGLYVYEGGEPDTDIDGYNEALVDFLNNKMDAHNKKVKESGDKQPNPPDGPFLYKLDLPTKRF